MEDIIEYFPPDPLSRSGPEGNLRIDLEITPPVSFMGDSESKSREKSTALQEEEEYNNQQSTSIVMTSEYKRLLIPRNAVPS